MLEPTVHIDRCTISPRNPPKHGLTVQSTHAATRCTAQPHTSPMRNQTTMEPLRNSSTLELTAQ
eukprot:4977043-Lingulodinium_polyedra.AAC.1